MGAFNDTYCEADKSLLWYVSHSNHTRGCILLSKIDGGHRTTYLEDMRFTTTLRIMLKRPDGRHIWWFLHTMTPRDLIRNDYIRKALIDGDDGSSLATNVQILRQSGSWSKKMTAMEYLLLFGRYDDAAQKLQRLGFLDNLVGLIDSQSIVSLDDLVSLDSWSSSDTSGSSNLSQKLLTWVKEQPLNTSECTFYICVLSHMADDDSRDHLHENGLIPALEELMQENNELARAKVEHIIRNADKGKREKHTCFSWPAVAHSIGPTHYLVSCIIRVRLRSYKRSVR